jgi:hypothetical protein
MGIRLTRPEIWLVRAFGLVLSFLITVPPLPVSHIATMLVLFAHLKALLPCTAGSFYVSL